jgi:hypothetical protein
MDKEIRRVTDYEDGFARGLRVCSDMLEYTDPDECQISGNCRGGRPQDNVVRHALGEVLMRGDAAELNGFCAALSEIVAFADESGDYYRGLAKQADRHERVMRRIAERRAARS